MTSDDARALLAPAITVHGGVWADLRAGEGTFTRALAELLGPDGRIYAVDRDHRAVDALMRWVTMAPCTVLPLQGDFSRPLDLPGATRLDGLLFANSLHYLRDADAVLTR